MNRRCVRALLAAFAAVALLAACKPFDRGSATDTGELVALRAEVERLRKENADLRLSPHTLAVEVDAAMRSNNEEKAAAAFKQLADTFPIAAETAEMRKRLEAFVAQRRAQEEEEKRIAALGFKGLPVTATFGSPDLSLTVGAVDVVKRWFFDSWGEGWRFLDAEKDRRILVARVNMASKHKEPSLFGIAAYVADGDKLTQLGTLRYRFARWSSYAAFLGTSADYRNEFSHSWRIPFTVGVSVSEQDLKRRPIYLVATTEACHQRHFERFGQPPIVYVAGECKTLKPSLKLDDFKGGTLAVLRRIE